MNEVLHFLPNLPLLRGQKKKEAGPEPTLSGPIHRSLPPDPILSEISPAQKALLCLVRTHFHIKSSHLPGGLSFSDSIYSRSDGCLTNELSNSHADVKAKWNLAPRKLGSTLRKGFPGGIKGKQLTFASSRTPIPQPHHPHTNA